MPFKIGGNVMNTGLITNLPREACVEVPCLVDASGVNADLCRRPAAAAGCAEPHEHQHTAADDRSGDHAVRRSIFIMQRCWIRIPAAELSMDDIVAMCDDLIEAHGDWLPAFK